MRRYLFVAAIAVAAIGAFFRVPLWLGLVVAAALVLTWVGYAVAHGWFRGLGHHHHHGRERHASEWPLVFSVTSRTKNTPGADADADKTPKDPRSAS